jgi:GAF domain-containing protein
VSAGDRLLAAGPGLVEALDALLTVARALPDVDAVRIWLRDEKTGGAVLAAETRVRAQTRRRVSRGPQDAGFAAVVLRRGRTVVARRACVSPRIAGAEWFRACGLLSYLGVPVRMGNNCVGVLACMSRTAKSWSRSEIAAAEALGALTGSGMHAASPHEGSLQRVAEAEKRARHAERSSRNRRVLTTGSCVRRCSV